jgi:hypothetical protein
MYWQVEDIIDTGHTLNKLVKHLSHKAPATVSVCALLNKEARRVVDIEYPPGGKEYIGFPVSDGLTLHCTLRKASPNHSRVGTSEDRFCALHSTGLDQTLGGLSPSFRHFAGFSIPLSLLIHLFLSI